MTYLQVNNIKKSRKTVVDACGQVQQDIKDFGWGKLMASAKDADGDITGLFQLAHGIDWRLIKW